MARAASRRSDGRERESVYSYGDSSGVESGAQFRQTHLPLRLRCRSAMIRANLPVRRRILAAGRAVHACRGSPRTSRAHSQSHARTKPRRIRGQLHCTHSRCGHHTEECPNGASRNTTVLTAHMTTAACPHKHYYHTANRAPSTTTAHCIYTASLVSIHHTRVSTCVV